MKPHTIPTDPTTDPTTDPDTAPDTDPTEPAEREAAEPRAASSSVESPSWPTPDEMQLRRNAKRPLTELATARRLVDYHGHDLRYCAKLGGWQVWDGRRWTHDETSEVHRRAQHVVDTLLFEEAKMRSGSECERHRKWAFACQSQARIDALVKVARTQRLVAVRHDVFDTNHELFNVANGTIELATGTFRPHHRDDLISKVASDVHYDPDATCPLWEAFLDRVLGGDEELRDYLQTLVGYSLSGRVTQHILPVLYGSGRNGKSTFIKTIERLFGEYAATADDDLLVASARGQHPTGKADLRGARLVTATETPQDANLNTQLVKKLTGGDTVKARKMREDFIEFQPAFTVFLATNHMPNIRDHDEGIWSRVKQVPFTEYIPPEERDDDLQDKLRDQLPGILNWALEGLARYREHGLVEPAVVTKATKAYRVESDVIGRFIDEKCERGTGKVVYSKDLYAAYTQWCADEGETAESQKALAESLKARGCDRLKNHGPSRRSAWTGIQLAP